MPGLSVIFWNLNRQPLEHRVARIVRAHGVDVVVLAECETDPTRVVGALTAAGAGPFRAVPDSGARLQLYDRTDATWRLLVKDQLEAWAGYVVAGSSLPAVLLFVAHMPSKLRTTEDDQLLDGVELAADVRAAELREGHERTILVGDLNVNPFERPAAWAKALHAVPTRAVAGRESRVIRDREYPMFYNPMWSVFSDRTPGPPGTYYRSSSATVNYFWNVFDQVLLRPSLMNRLVELRVLESDGVETLLTPGGLPDATAGSDHLPLYFRLEW